METLTKTSTQDLRSKWIETKKLLSEGKLTEVKAIISEHGLNVSPYSYFFVSLQMKAKGFDGIPYLDCKTFKGWADKGFHVIKGEKSVIKGVTWITPTYKDKTTGEIVDSDYLFPKEYHLFHRSQVR